MYVFDSFFLSFFLFFAIYFGCSSGREVLFLFRLSSPCTMYISDMNGYFYYPHSHELAIFQQCSMMESRLTITIFSRLRLSKTTAYAE